MFYWLFCLFSFQAKPEINLNATSVEIFEREAIRIDCTASGRPTPTVKWKLGAKVLQSAPSNILEIQDAKKNDSGVYNCVAENEYGNVSKTAKIVVKDEAPSLPSLKIINRTEKSLLLFGEGPKYVGRGDKIKYFHLRCKKLPLNLKINKSNSFKVNIDNLEPSSTYAFELTACNPYVCSKSVLVNFTTAEPGQHSSSNMLCNFFL